MTYENKGMLSPKYIVSSFGDGNFNTNGTADQVEINLAINSLTAVRDWREKVLLKGDFTIDGPIVMPAYTVLGGPAKIYLADNSDCNQIQNATPGGTDVMCIVEDLTLDMDPTQQASGHNIYWRQAAQPPSGREPLIIFRRLNLTDARDDGLHVDMQGGGNSYVQISDVFQRFAFGYGINLRYVFDHWVDNCHFTGEDGSMFFHCTSGLWGGLYFGHMLTTQSCSGMWGNRIFIDMGYDTDAWDMLGSQDFNMENINIRIALSDPFVGNSAIHCHSDGGNHATNNMFNHIKAGRWRGVGTNRFNFIIEEDANAAGNSWKDVQPDDYVTAVMDTQSTPILDFLPWNFVPYNGAAMGPWGVDVDAASEGAITGGILPPSVHEVVFVVIDGMTTPGSGAQEMEIELNIDGGQGGQGRATHSTALANLDSDQTAVGATENITWTLNSRDHATLRALTGLDRVRVQVLHEVGAGGDASTDVELGSATLYYV